MTLPKMMAAALVAALLALAAAPARSAETATADDTARFLAGLPPAPDSPLAELAKGPLWQRHARYFDTIFGREDSANLSEIRAFSRERLTDKHETMLYMFSGPDFLYATSFFPTASTYVLAGLEPVGEIPPLTALSHPTVEWTLRNLESSLGSLLSFSFFITKNMKTQLHEGPVYGTLPILYVFLARTGKTIHDVSFSAMTWIGPRVTMTMGEDMSLLRIFARKSKQNVPAVAIIFQLLVSNLLLLTQSFEAVLDFIQFSLTFCSFFAVLGVIKMRITHPKLARPYRAWGYPVTPLIFLSVTLFMMYYLVVNRPLQSLAGFAMMSAGLIIYYTSRLLSDVPSSDASQTVA